VRQSPPVSGWCKFLSCRRPVFLWIHFGRVLSVSCRHNLQDCTLCVALCGV